MPFPDRYAVCVTMYAFSNVESPIDVNEAGTFLNLLIPIALIASVESGMLNPTLLRVVHPLNESSSIACNDCGRITLLNAIQSANAPFGTTPIVERRKSTSFRREHPLNAFSTMLEISSPELLNASVMHDALMKRLPNEYGPFPLCMHLMVCNDDKLDNLIPALRSKFPPMLNAKLFNELSPERQLAHNIALLGTSNVMIDVPDNAQGSSADNVDGS